MKFNKNNIAVCILFFEKPNQTIECIKSFLNSDVKIYIQNNNSSKYSYDLVYKFINKYPKINIYNSKKNLGVSGGRNNIIKKTKEEWLFFVDSDITIKTKNWFFIIKRIIENEKNIDAIIPKLYNKHDRQYALHLKINIKDKKVVFEKAQTNKNTNSFPGGASIINRKMFDRLGMYNEEMFIGFEDFELCVRAIKQKKPINSKIIDKVVLVHDHRQAKTIQDKNAATERYNIRKIQHSYNIFKEKYNLDLDNDWKPWVYRQMELITAGNDLLTKFKKWIFNVK